MLVRELIYMISDLLKLSSDDVFYTEEHILFLCKHYRALLIKKEQEKDKEESVSEFEYQQICLDLEKTEAIDGEPCTGGYYLRTVKKIPKILEGTKPRIYPIDYYQGINISFISRDRMRYVGSNPYLQNIIYVSIGPDLHLYLNSSNPQFMYLKKLRMLALFDDIEATSELLCDDEGNTEETACDAFDMQFPIREYLIPTLIELVVKELSQSKPQLEDTDNNANDDLPGKYNSKAQQYYNKYYGK